jgi:hypothetical protein
MKRHLTIPLAIVLALLVPTLAVSAWGGGNHPDNPERELRLLRDLSEAQRSELEELREAHRLAAEPLHDELRALCAAGERNTERAREVRDQLEELVRAHLSRASSVLSTEQLNELAELDPDHPLVTGEPRHDIGDGGCQPGHGHGHSTRETGSGRDR